MLAIDSKQGDENESTYRIPRQDLDQEIGESHCGTGCFEGSPLLR